MRALSVVPHSGILGFLFHAKLKNHALRATYRQHNGLAAHSTQPKYQFSVRYGVGDVVIWDNAAVLHAATLVDPADARTLWRITGERA